MSNTLTIEIKHLYSHRLCILMRLKKKSNAEGFDMVTAHLFVQKHVRQNL